MTDKMLPLRWRMVVTFLCVVMSGCSGRMAPTTRPTVATGDGAEILSNATPEVASADRADGLQPGFYPLRIGNRWDYLINTTYRAIPNSGEFVPPEVAQARVTRRQVATEVYDSHQYVLEDLITVGTLGPPMASVPYRQDGTGLYELNLVRGVRSNGVRAAVSMAATAATGPGVRPLDRSLAIFSPSEQAAYRLAARRLEERIATAGAVGIEIPGSAAPYELTRLRYPLHTRTRWVDDMGNGFTVASEVVGSETLELPPGSLVGYRIRVHFSLMGPNDSYETWFGPSGFLQSVLHAEVDAVDNTGNVIGKVAIDQREELQSLQLTGPSGPTLPPWLTPRRK